MKYHPRNPTPWRKKFAFFPIIIGKKKDGSPKKAWLIFVEVRTFDTLYASDYAYFFTEARMPGSRITGANVDLKSYC